MKSEEYAETVSFALPLASRDGRVPSISYNTGLHLIGLLGDASYAWDHRGRATMVDDVRAEQADVFNVECDLHHDIAVVEAACTEMHGVRMWNAFSPGDRKYHLRGMDRALSAARRAQNRGTH